MVKAHDWQLDWEYLLPTDLRELFMFFKTCDVFLLVEAWCASIAHFLASIHVSEFDKKG